MFQAIASTFRYSFMVLGVLVLSHIIQVRGTSISRHVENAMNWVAGISPMDNIEKVNRSMSSAIHSRNEQLKKAEEIPDEDQKKLKEIIRESGRR